MVVVRVRWVRVQLGAAIAVVVTASAQTTVTPTPVSPTPVAPAPVAPAPVAPTNVQPTNVQPSNVQPTNVQPSNVQPTPQVPTTTQPAPTTGNPFSIDLAFPNGRPSDFALAQYPPGFQLQLGATFTSSTGQTIPGQACVPVYELADQLAPNGDAYARLVGDNVNGNTCTGNCSVEFLQPQANPIQSNYFSVSVHCQNAPQISSLSHAQYQMITSTDRFAGGAPHAKAPAPNAPAAAHGKPNPNLALELGLVIGGGVVAGYLLSGGGGGSHCFTISNSTDNGACPDGTSCDVDAASCETDLSDAMKLCHGAFGDATATFTDNCGSSNRSVPPAPARAPRPATTAHAQHVRRRIGSRLITVRSLHPTSTRATNPPSPRAASARPPPATVAVPPRWLGAALGVAALATTSYAAWILSHPHAHRVEWVPWVQLDGGGVTVMGAF